MSDCQKWWEHVSILYRYRYRCVTLTLPRGGGLVVGIGSQGTRLPWPLTLCLYTQYTGCPKENITKVVTHETELFC